MKHFLIVSAARAHDGEALSLTARTFAAREEWPDATSLRIAGPGFQELLVWGQGTDDVLDVQRGEASLLLGRAALDGRGNRLTPRSVADRVAVEGPRALAAVAAPQGFAIASDDVVIAATDHVGLVAVYHAAGRDLAAAGTSSRLVAAVLNRGLDEDAVSAFSVLGEYPSTDTPFAGVSRLAASQMTRLSGGKLTVEAYADPPAAPRSGAGDLRAAVAEGADAVRTAVEACADAYPDAAMELSGGLDSRVILAALMRSGRRPAAGVTLGEPLHPDVIVARSLAARAGVPFQHVDLRPMSDVAPSEALALADFAGRRRDYSGNCVALGVLEWVDRVAGTGRPRMSGQNGELARGFYYPLQPSWPRTTDALARSLVRWRLMANERVSGDLLAPEATTAGERRAAAATKSFLQSTGCDWLTATDMLYLHWRMQRWVGADWTAAAQSRPVLAPFFHPRYITWALAAPARYKRGSRLLARVLDALDPGLAQIPVAGGEAPAVMFRPRPGDRVARASRTAQKVGVKVRQRLSDSAKAPVGAPALADLALAAMADERVGLERVAALPFVNSEYVERAAEERTAAPTTVGLLVALRGLTA